MEVRYKITNETNLVITTMKTFLSHIDTKQELTVYLAKKAIPKFSEIRMSYIVTYDTMSVTNIEYVAFGIDVHDHEEADTLLISHVIEVSHRLPFCKCIIYSPDTDVFLLLVHYYPSIPSATKFKTGKGADIRTIVIGNCYEAIEPLRVSSDLGFHTFTGCDQTGKFRGKSKSTWWKSFIETSSKTLNALSLLDSSESLPHLTSLKRLNRLLYKHVLEISVLNTSVLCPSYDGINFESSKQTDKLPPTASTSKYNIFRGHYVAVVLKRSHLSLQNPPPPEDFGWKKIDGELVPIMTDCLPAPMTLIELSVCGCKSNCKPIDANVRKTVLLVQVCTSCDNSGTQENDDSDIEIDDKESD